MLTLELLFQKRDPPVLVVAGSAGAGLECGSGVLEEFLLPTVEHRGVDPVLVTQVRNGGVFEKMEPKNGDLLLSCEAIPDFLGHGKTSTRNCSLFEQTVCHISTEAKHLKLSLDDFRTNADAIEQGTKLTARFLAREKVFDTKSLPYSSQIIPLSGICAILGDQFEHDSVRKKLAQWFWCGVFGELYGGASETRFALDLPDVLAWIRGGDLPRTIRDASFSPTRLLTMQSRLSAAYKGLMALMMKQGSADFLSGDSIELSTYFDLNIDIHHIFPRAYCEKQNLRRTLWNSAVNKAPLSAKTNRVIGGKAPSVYLKSIEQNHQMPNDRLDEILRSHQIDPALLRSDAFEEFIRNRAGKLLDVIEREMGKAVPGRDADKVIREFGGPIPASGSVAWSTT